MSNRLVPQSEFEASILGDWLQFQMNRDVAKQGWYVNVVMGMDGIAEVIWDKKQQEFDPTTLLGGPIVRGKAWFDVKREQAAWECGSFGGSQSNDVGFGPVLS